MGEQTSKIMANAPEVPSGPEAEQTSPENAAQTTVQSHHSSRRKNHKITTAEIGTECTYLSMCYIATRSDVRANRKRVIENG